MPFSTLTRLITLSLVLLAALALPTAAGASGEDVIRDCAQDGDLDKEYSDEELEEGEENMPGDVDAYTGCRDVIRAAQAGGEGGAGSDSEPGGGASGSGGGGGDANEKANTGATAKDAEELNKRAEDAQNGVAPEADAALPASADAAGDDGLPTPALVAIALLGLAAVGGGVYLLRDYLPSGLTSRLPGANR